MKLLFDDEKFMAALGFSVAKLGFQVNDIFANRGAGIFFDVLFA